LHRRISQRLWKRDPTIQWSSIVVDELTMARLVAILADYGVYRDRSFAHGYPPTPRAWDRCLHAARKFLVCAIGQDQFRRRIVAAVRDDARYWATASAAGADHVNAKEHVS
jgi:hypothetical protein